MKTRLGLLLVLMACGERDIEGARDSVHAGEPTVVPRGPVDSTPPEIRFLEFMIGHQSTIGDVLDRAQRSGLTPAATTMVEHARKHWFEHEADLMAARQSFGGGRRSREPVPRETVDSLERLRGMLDEGSLLTSLARHYREEVITIDSSLPGLSVEHVRELALRIRSQRLHDIQELTRRGPAR